jgi:hypothetical protein
MLRSSVSELVTMLEARKVEDADDARVKGLFSLSLRIDDDVEVTITGAGRGTDMSTAQRRAAQLRSVSRAVMSVRSGRRDNRVRNMLGKLFFSHSAIGESFCPNR